jgi:amino acid transporter
LRWKITLLQLVAATYFMVAGGPYGLEDLVQKAGYTAAVLVLLITPLIWSLPTALMVSELSSAVPEEGGYYAWVRRAMGPFWGFQEAWLSLAASIFDMAIYPKLFAEYLGRLLPTLSVGYIPFVIGLAMIAVCVVANIRGTRVVGGSSVVMTVVMLGPFVVLTVVAFVREPVPVEQRPLLGDFDVFLGGLLVAVWNYMGWDNASTIAGEVERPQRTYPLAMISAVTLVTFTYVLPVLAASRTGLDPAKWETGSWVVVAETVAGPALGVAVGVGGMISAFGMFNALVLSYSRIPVVLAEDGYLPAILKRRHSRTGAPSVAIIACAVAWALALQLSLPRLFALDIILYGLSLMLEFVALIYLRVREPELPRPFRVPGGMPGAVLLGVGPALLIAVAIYHERAEMAGPINALLLGGILVALGPIVYFASRQLQTDTQPS